MPSLLPLADGMPAPFIEGDRRFELQVRLPEQLRGDIEALKRLPIGLPLQSRAAANTGRMPAAAAVHAPAYVTLGEVARFEVVRAPIR